MKIIGTGKKVGGKSSIIVEISEAEADMITGIAGRPHISGRYKSGRTVNIAKMYDKVKLINEKYKEIKSAAAKLKSDADDIGNSIPLGD